MREKRITFKPIPGHAGGEIHLEIYPPGTWFNDPSYVCFVGGGGVGHRPTLPAAKKFLLSSARNILHRRVTELEDAAEHYRRELKKLTTLGKRTK